MPLLSTALSIAQALDVDLMELIGYKAPEQEDIRGFYARYRILDELRPEQSNLLMALTKEMIARNASQI